jgi:hypothetical protein
MRSRLVKKTIPSGLKLLSYCSLTFAATFGTMVLGYDWVFPL